MSRARLAALVVVLAAIAPAFLGDDAAWRSAANAVALLLAALGLNAAAGYGGLPSLGQGAFVGIGAYATAVMRADAGADPITAMLAGAALATAAGFVVGHATARLRPAFVAIATWLVSWTFALFVSAFPGVSGGASGIVLDPATLDTAALGLSATLGPVAFYEIGLALVVLAVVATAVALRRFGPALAAMRADAAAAECSGVRVESLRRGTIAASALAGGVAGALLVQIAGVADPTRYGPVLSVELFIVVLVGGAGRLLGPMLGLAALAVVNAEASVIARAAPAGSRPLAAGLALLIIAILGGRGIALYLPRKGPQPAADPPPLHLPPGGALSLRDVRVSFGGIAALDGVSLDVRAGECHAIVGHNGSGKTTLLRVLSGTVAPDAGTIMLDDAPLPAGVHERLRAGIVRTFQRTAVEGGMTSLEHVLAGCEPRRETGLVHALLRGPRAKREHARALGHATAALTFSGLSAEASRDAALVDAGKRRLLQIARALASSPRVLLLDEPATGLDAEQQRDLAGMIATLTARGTTVVVVEHNLRLVAGIADRVTVLDSGRVADEGTPRELEARRALAR